MSLKVLISGSSGFVGKNLTVYLKSKGIEIIPLVREKNRPHTVFWDPEKKTFELQNLQTIDAVIHLSGENVGSYWTKSKKKRIYDSRVQSSKFFIDSLKKAKLHPKVFISASAIGYYGNRDDEILTEESAKGEGFLSDVCADWEKEVLQISDMSRVISLRFGHILGKDGGILLKLSQIYRLGLGGKMGSGNQYISWISMDDICEIILQSLLQEHWVGPINCVSTNPIKQKQFGQTLCEVLHRPFWFHIPTMCLKLLLKEQALEMFLASQRVIPEKLRHYGYTFIDTDVKLTFHKYLKK